jgi:hypothetical protein
VTLVVMDVGLGLSLTWWAVQRRVLGHLARHERLMERLEKRLYVPSELAVSASINWTDYKASMPRWPQGRPVMGAFNIVSAILWAMALIYWGLLGL